MGCCVQSIDMILKWVIASTYVASGFAAVERAVSESNETAETQLHKQHETRQQRQAIEAEKDKICQHTKRNIGLV